MGDRIAVMRDGEIVQCDRPMAIYDHPADQFVGGFIGSPPMNFLRGTVADGQFRGEGFSVPAAGVPAGEAALGIRAEHLALADAGIPAQVLVVEPLGAHALVTARVGSTPVKIQTAVDTAVRPNEQVHLHLDPARIRWMDAAGAALDGR